MMSVCKLILALALGFTLCQRGLCAFGVGDIDWKAICPEAKCEFI